MAEPDFDLEAMRAMYTSAYEPGGTKVTGRARAAVGVKPTIKQLVEQARDEPTVDGLFGKGDWVEIRGDDLKWALAQITDVKYRPVPGWDKELPENKDKTPPQDRFLYFGTGENMFGRIYDDFEIRAPVAGLKKIFGMRPFLWQQYALIRLEAYLRMEENHIYDFEDFDIFLTVRDWWNEWLNHSDNSDFLEEVFRDEEPYAQKLLEHHLFTPFKLLENIREDKEDWDFEDESITVYSYLGVLGDGILMVVLVFGMQIVIPCVLLYTATVYGTEGGVTRRGGGGGSTEVEYNRRFEEPQKGELFGSTNWDLFCSNEGSPEGKILLAAVIFMYLTQVIPDTLYAFFNVAGVGDSTFSKMTSLRRIVNERRRDSFSQIVGFILDRVMNTAYISALYLVMLYILLMTDNVLDIILNALAIIFIHQLDERIANAPWWDQKLRWITAGTMELVFQSIVDKEALGNARKMCQVFDIDFEETYCKTFEYKPSAFTSAPSLKDRRQAEIDEEDSNFKEAKISRNVITFDESTNHFGILEKVLNQTKLTRLQGTFNHYEDYRVWSKWDDVIFMSNLPGVNDEIDEDEKPKAPLADLDSYRTFIREVFTSVFLLKPLVDNVASAFSSNKLWKIPFLVFVKFLKGMVEWVSFAIPVFFPVIVFVGLVMIPYCY